MDRRYKSSLKCLKIGDKVAELPIIQGGMGVGVSRSSLAGAVAAEGGVGVISTAQIGYDEAGFESCMEAQRQKARGARKETNYMGADANVYNDIAKGKGLVGVNIMVALKHYKEHVKEAVECGADVIISGAGLPMNLPELVPEFCRTKIAPIVSSKRAANLILKMWAHRYNRTADLIVVEGPEAGGHLGFSRDQLAHRDEMDFDQEIRDIIACKKEYEEKFGREIPVVVAGGIFDRKDIDHAMALGADGVQIASRFVATKECDADERYKQAYVNARKEDVQIIQSPVGMPGRALCNPFMKLVENGRIPVKKCYNCLEKCNPGQVPYCITKALIDAVEGDVENGLMFCGANVGRIDKITSVHELMRELAEG